MTIIKLQDPVRSKIVISNNTVEQVNTFIYLRCSTAYRMTKITVKISTFLQVTGIFNRTLKPSPIQKHSRVKICNTLALPTLLYKCETWAVREKDQRT
jgi:hypothetical protein